LAGDQARDLEDKALALQLPPQPGKLFTGIEGEIGRGYTYHLASTAGSAASRSAYGTPYHARKRLWSPIPWLPYAVYRPIQQGSPKRRIAKPLAEPLWCQSRPSSRSRAQKRIAEPLAGARSRIIGRQASRKPCRSAMSVHWPIISPAYHWQASES